MTTRKRILYPCLLLGSVLVCLGLVLSVDGDVSLLRDYALLVLMPPCAESESISDRFHASWFILTEPNQMLALIKKSRMDAREDHDEKFEMRLSAAISIAYFRAFGPPARAYPGPKPHGPPETWH